MFKYLMTLKHTSYGIFTHGLWKKLIKYLQKNCPYSELFWFSFSRIRTEYGEILRISPYSIRMRENADQNNSEYGLFLLSVTCIRTSQSRIQNYFKRLRWNFLQK